MNSSNTHPVEMLMISISWNGLLDGLSLRRQTFCAYRFLRSKSATEYKERKYYNVNISVLKAKKKGVITFLTALPLSLAAGILKPVIEKVANCLKHLILKKYLYNKSIVI